MRQKLDYIPFSFHSLSSTVDHHHCIVIIHGRSFRVAYASRCRHIIHLVEFCDLFAAMTSCSIHAFACCIHDVGFFLVFVASSSSMSEYAACVSVCVLFVLYASPMLNYQNICLLVTGYCSKVELWEKGLIYSFDVYRLADPEWPMFDKHVAWNEKGGENDEGISERSQRTKS